jgi:hypothetical protein
MPLFDFSLAVQDPDDGTSWDIRYARDVLVSWSKELCQRAKLRIRARTSGLIQVALEKKPSNSKRCLRPTYFGATIRSETFHFLHLTVKESLPFIFDENRINLRGTARSSKIRNPLICLMMLHARVISLTVPERGQQIGRGSKLCVCWSRFLKDYMGLMGRESWTMGDIEGFFHPGLHVSTSSKR